MPLLLTKWSCAFLANVISGIISTLQLRCDCSMLSTESPQVAWEENSRIDSSRHGIQTWQLEHFLGPTIHHPPVVYSDLSAGLLGRENRPGSRCTESSVSPRNSSVWTKYFSTSYKYLHQTCQCLESVKLGVRRWRDLQSRDHPPARWWRWAWLGSNVVMMGNKKSIKNFSQGTW